MLGEIQGIWLFEGAPFGCGASVVKRKGRRARSIQTTTQRDNDTLAYGELDANAFKGACGARRRDVYARARYSARRRNMAVNNLVHLNSNLASPMSR